jgi:hypothetical protein
MTRRMRLRSGRWTAFAVTLVLGAIACVACSFIVGDSLPTFACVPEAGSGACRSDQACRPNPLPRSGFSCQARCPAAPCGAGESCDQGTGQCTRVGDNDATNDTTGDDGPGLTADVRVDATVDGDAATDVETGLGDVQMPCHGLGCRCSSSADCDMTFACADKQAVAANTPSGWGGDGGHFCLEPCCTSLDCDMGDGGSGATVCFATGAGGNYCVPPSWLGDRSAIGGASGGASCGTDASPACRSGLCLDSGVCADTCCSTKSSTECATNVACRVGAFPGSGFDTHESAHCGPAPTGAGTGGCMMNSDCRSNLCVDTMMFGSMSCRDACRNRDDCSPPGTPMYRTQACEYIQPAPPSTDVVAACAPLNTLGFGDGGGGDGSKCVTSSDCARGYCAMQPGGQGVCLSSCFVDGDCPSPERCRPQQILIVSTTYSVLACGM